MDIREVTEYINNSFLKISSSKILSCTALPRVIKLLGISKKKKAEIIEQAFFDFVRGEDSVIILSVATSSKLFKFILSHTPQVWFVENRVVDKGKRLDVIALFFTHKPLSF